MSALFAVKFHLPITVEHYLNALFMVFVDYPPMSNLDNAGAVMVFAMKTAGIPVNSIIPHGSSGTIDNHSPHIVDIFNNNDPDQFQSPAGYHLSTCGIVEVALGHVFFSLLKV